MRTLFLLLSLSLTPFYLLCEENFSVNENTSSVAALEGLPSSIVAGSVCAISGLYLDHSVDFALPGPETLVFERTYSSAPLSGNLGMGWNGNQRDWLRFNVREYEGKDVWGCFLVETSGARLFYKRSYHEGDKKHSSLSLSRVKSKGMTNGSAREISGRTNPKNKRMEWLPRDDKFVCTNGAQDRLTFRSDKAKNIYGLSKQEKSNGSSYRYKFHSDPFMHTDEITCYNSHTKQPYSALNIKFRKKKERYSHIFLETSDKREISYKFREHSFTELLETRVGDQIHRQTMEYYQNYLSEVKSPSKPTEKYSYGERKSYPGLLLSKKKLPEQRYVKINYYQNTKYIDVIGGVRVRRDKLCVDRVQSLEAPVGTTDQPIKTHQFLYNCSSHRNSGSTHVFDAYQHQTRYHYDEDHLLTSITKYRGRKDYETYSKEKFVWGVKDNQGNLKARYLVDHKNHALYLKSYQYDKAGNILENRLYGCLTGKNQEPLVLDSRGKPQSACECDLKTATYSHRNLKESETDNQGVTTLFHYEPHSDRLKARFVMHAGHMISREFFKYDENHVVCKKISDDGRFYDLNNLQGVTQREVIEYKNRLVAPIGLPEEETHYYLDLKTGQLHQLKRLVYAYTKEGWIKKQEFYDADNIFCYRQETLRDAHGNVIRETDPMGEVTLKTYDENDNLMTEIHSSGYQLHNQYDFMNRLIQKEEVHPDGQHFVESYTYDYLNNCTSRVNSYGHETKLDYDEFNRVVAIHLPAQMNEERKWVEPVTRTEYDLLNHPICVTDALGCQTLTTYNIRGQPLKINYPDGTFEQFFYRVDGKLVSKRSREGIKTAYELDPLGRILVEAEFFNEKLLRKKQNVYSSFHLIKSIDAHGVETHYKYDGAGRLVWVTNENARSQTLYDSLGRPSTIKEWYGKQPHEYRATIKKHDFLNRLIEERLEDHTGMILSQDFYEYDCNGNRTLVQNGEQITRTLYNFHNNPVQIINAAGEITHTSYNYAFINPHGQKVLQTTITDAKGYQTVDTYDAANRLVHSKRLNLFGILLSQEERFYDLKGNKCRIEEALIEEEKIKRKVVTLFTYEIDNQLSSLVEAYGTAEQKTTRYEYNAKRQLAKLIKPSGQQLIYTYDQLGRVKKLESSDKSTHYLYEHNLLDQIIAVHDLTTDQTTRRDYNPKGELLKETFAYGLSIDYHYDDLGRTTQLTFPDQSSVEYVYNAVDLLAAHRFVEGKLLYSHLEQKRNLSGQILEALPPGQNGQIRYAYDSMGRCTLIESNAYTQEVPKEGYDALGNLIIYQSQGQEHQFEYDDLNQLCSESGYVSHTYRFNSLANRTQKDNEICKYNALNQLIKKGDQTFKYDENGNLRERNEKGKITTYRYDALDRLISINTDDQKTEYTYDPFDRRISQTLNGETSYFLYIGQEEMGLWKQEEFKQFRLLVKNPMSITAVIELDHKVYIPRHDLSGNIVCLTTEEGEVIERYRYTAFGESQILNANDEQIKDSLIGNPWQYSSKRKDESGLIAFGLRYYDPNLARWLTPDPAGFESGSNLYAYIHNSPLVYKDRFGLFGENMWGLGRYIFPPLTQNFPETISFSYEEMYLNGVARFCNEDRDTLVFEKSANYDLNELKFLDADGVPMQFNQTGLGLGFVNGIDNWFKDASQSAFHLGKLCDHNVMLTHAASMGKCHDAVRYVLARCGVATEAVQRMQESWYKYFDEHKDGYIFWVCHSRGAADTRNALISFPNELRQRIVVLAVAPGAFIDKHLCKSVLHLVTDWDFVPKFDSAGRERCLDTVQFIQGTGNPSADHAFTNKIYSPHIKKNYDDFLEKYL